MTLFDGAPRGRSRMRANSSILLGVMLWSACVATEPGPWPDSVPKPDALTKPDDVPMPTSTPYARSSVEEAEYLRLFRGGYEAGRLGRRTTYCLFGKDFQNPVLVARSAGWGAGQDEGFEAFHEEVEQTIAKKDRRRLLVLFEFLGQEAAAFVDELLSAGKW